MNVIDLLLSTASKMCAKFVVHPNIILYLRSADQGKAYPHGSMVLKFLNFCELSSKARTHHRQAIEGLGLEPIAHHEHLSCQEPGNLVALYGCISMTSLVNDGRVLSQRRRKFAIVCHQNGIVLLREPLTLQDLGVIHFLPEFFENPKQLDH